MHLIGHTFFLMKTFFFTIVIYDVHLISTGLSNPDKICNKPQVFHRILDEQCNQTNICSMPVNATLRAPVFNQTDIAFITHTMMTSSRLYQDIARLTCKYNINQIEKEDVIEVCKKLGISCSSSSNVATKACRHHRMYILANINDVNCSITKQCSIGIDPFKVDQVQTGNKSNSLVVTRSLLKYSRLLYLFSSLVCRINREHIFDYPQDGAHQKQEQSLANTGNNREGVVISVILVTAILLAGVGAIIYIAYIYIRVIMYTAVNISFV